MAYVSGIDDEDELLRAAAASAGGAPAPASGTPAGGAPRQAGTGFVNFNQILGLNSAGGQQMAGALAGDLQNRATQAGSAFDAAQGDEAKARAKSDATDIDARAGIMGSGDVGSLLGDVYGGGKSYSSGEKSFDNALAGGAAGSTLRNAGGRYGYFSSMLGVTPSKTERPTGQSGPGSPGSGSAGDDIGGGGAGPMGGPGGVGGGGRRDIDLPNPLDPDLNEWRRRRTNPYASILGG